MPRLLFTMAIVQLVVGTGVVPRPWPRPRYIMHVPHGSESLNMLSFSATECRTPLVHGRCIELAKLPPKLHVPAASWSICWP